MLIQIQFVVSKKKKNIVHNMAVINKILGKTFFEILEYLCNHNTCNITTTDG